jgi:hypothetical protein
MKTGQEIVDNHLNYGSSESQRNETKSNETASQSRRQQPNLTTQKLQLLSRDKKKFTATAYKQSITPAQNPSRGRIAAQLSRCLRMCFYNSLYLYNAVYMSKVSMRDVGVPQRVVTARSQRRNVVRICCRVPSFHSAL